ncbi:MAG: phosphotransferase [bacterium]|nr:DUF1679 domain-containing protein [Gammaproteobacteria bacterium]
MNDTDLAFQRVAEHIDPNARLVRHWPLTGGVSAQIDALELELPGQAHRQIVVRRHGNAQWKSHQDDATTTEFALLTSLFQMGLPVPEPLFLDVSASVLPSPYLVMAMVDGTTDIPDSQLPVTLRQLAAFLSHLHSLDIEALTLPPLSRLEDPVSGALEYLPQTSSWAPLRAAVSSWETVSARDSLLHGDFWPGNVLWTENRIAAVIDWEDATLGTAVSDLACCRAELMVLYGQQAMEAFTAQYLANSKVDVTDLPLWDVYVAISALATMHNWQLTPEIEARRRERTTVFLDRAADETIHCIKSTK